MFSLESLIEAILMKTQYTVFNLIKENHSKLSQNLQPGDFFQGTQERFRNSHGKRAISVRATEVLMYKLLLP